MIAGFVIACVVLVVFGVLALLVAPFERRRPLPPPEEAARREFDSIALHQRHLSRGGSR